MCVFHCKYMYSAALTPARPPARPPASPPSPASTPASRSASQKVPRASGITVGNANEVRNRSTLRTDPSTAYIQLPRRNGRSPGRSAAAPRQASAGARVPNGVPDNNRISILRGLTPATRPTGPSEFRFPKLENSRRK